MMMISQQYEAAVSLW